tara:strand:+ start:4045 stop:7257 length:3213 start_codon:yes stop_codon:yes gene_type:complete
MTTNNYFLDNPIDQFIYPYTGSFSDCFAIGLNNYRQLCNGNTTNLTELTKVLVQYGLADIATGDNFTIFVTNDNKTYAIGYNGHGNLGTGNTTQMNTITEIMSDYKVKNVFIGGNFTMFLTIDGEVYACGENNYGQLGDGTTTQRTTPVQVMKNFKVKEICCGEQHTIFCTENGLVFACGRNDLGQLGTGNTTNQSTPFKVMSEKHITKIRCTAYSTFFITIDRELFSTGYNQYGELGIGNTTKQLLPVQIMNDYNIVDVQCGFEHILIHTTNTTGVYGCGRNNYHQLGFSSSTHSTITTPKLIPNTNQVTNIACGHSSSFYIIDYIAYGFGRNNYYQLGDNSSIDRYVPTLVQKEKGLVFIKSNYNSSSTFFGTVNLDSKLGISNFNATLSQSGVTVTASLSTSITSVHTYSIFAVTNPNTSTETIDQILADTSLSEGILKNTLLHGSLATINTSLSYAIDDGLNIVPITSINNCKVYVYITDNISKDLSSITIDPYVDFDKNSGIDEKPYIKISSLELNESGSAYILNCSAYSSITNIPHIIGGTISVTNNITPSENEIIQFFVDNKDNTNVLGVSSTTLSKYRVGLFTFTLRKAFVNLDSSAEVDVVNSSNHLVRLIAKDENNNSSIDLFITRFDLMNSDNSFIFDYKSLNVEYYYFNKAVNYRWCAKNANGLIFFTWASMLNGNSKTGIYTMIANAASGSMSPIFEVMYDGSIDYMLPCITVINNSTFAIAYKYNNGSYQATMYYNILTYSDLNILSNTKYSFGTQTRDHNSRIDIDTIDENSFIVCWNDYSLQARYNRHCGRRSCHNHHSGYNYLYDIEYRIIDVNNTNIQNMVVFENNDSNSHKHKVCHPSIGVSTSCYCIVYQYYGNVYASVFNSSRSKISGNKQISTTELQEWNYNDSNPKVIESLTPDNFVIAWFDNTHHTRNYVKRVYVREMNSTGTFITSEIKIFETSNKEHYFLGQPQIFKNNGGYDLFFIRKENVGAVNHPVYRHHCQLNASLNLTNSTILDYQTEKQFDILEYIGSPVSIVKLDENKFQESIMYTNTLGASTYGQYDLQISSGSLF